MAFLRDCEGVEEGKDKVSVGKNILKEVTETFEAIKLEESTGQMLVENQFNTGLTKNLVPWIDRLETESLRSLEKPENFAHAQEIERESVVFAKDVRKANKLLGNLTGMVDNLPSKKMFSNQLIDDQKLRSSIFLVSFSYKYIFQIQEDCDRSSHKSGDDQGAAGQLELLC